MKKTSVLAIASLVSLLAVGTLALPAYAWSPKGTIIKEVQNQTAGSVISDANDAASAIGAAPGDMLVYTITVNNDSDAASNGNNDMTNTTLTDTLPDGIALVSDPSQRTISEDLGTIAPGKSVTKTYSVKVTSTTDGGTITNKACFTGQDKANNSPQSGCDVAVVKVQVAPTAPSLSTPPTPVPPATPPVAPSTTQQALPLPNTGSTALSAATIVIGGVIAGYLLNTLRLKRRSNV